MTSPGEVFRIQAQGRCTTCQQRIDGEIAYGEDLLIVDSVGFMVFEGGLTCDSCLGEDPRDEDAGL